MKKHRYENGNPPQSINDWRYHIVKDGMPMNVGQCLEELNRLQHEICTLERSLAQWQDSHALTMRMLAND